MNDAEPLRPMDFYDPEEIGVPATSLVEALSAFDDAIAGLHRLRQRLLGCTTPLNLYGTDRAISSALTELQEQYRQLGLARKIIEGDAPLPAFFPDDSDAWAVREGSVLSPAQLGYLSGVADRVPAENLTTYRKELSALAETPRPTLAERAIQEREQAAAAEERRAASEARLAAREELRERILADMESHPCESCGAESGSACITKSGRIASPHAARKHLSKLAKEYPGEAKFVQRIDPDYRSRQIQPMPRPTPEQSSEERADQGNVREAVAMLADSLRFEGRA